MLVRIQYKSMERTQQPPAVSDARTRIIAGTLELKTFQFGRFDSRIYSSSTYIHTIGSFQEFRIIKMWATSAAGVGAWGHEVHRRMDVVYRHVQQR